MCVCRSHSVSRFLLWWWSNSVLDLNMESISSTNTMHGCSFLAAVKIALVRRGVSPIHFRSRREGTIRIIGRFVFLDRASTRAVFPHPAIVVHYIIENKVANQNKFKEKEKEPLLYLKKFSGVLSNG